MWPNLLISAWQCNMIWPLQMLCDEVKCSCSFWRPWGRCDSQRPKRTLGVPGNGTLRYLIATAGQLIKIVTLEDSPLLVAYEDFWEKRTFLLTSTPCIQKPQRRDPPIFEASWNMYKNSCHCADLACYFKAGYWSECGLDRLWKRGRKGRRKVKQQ